GLVGLLGSCFEDDPRHRPRDAGELVRRLEAARGRAPPRPGGGLGLGAAPGGMLGAGGLAWGVRAAGLGGEKRGKEALEVERREKPAPGPAPGPAPTAALTAGRIPGTWQYAGKETYWLDFRADGYLVARRTSFGGVAPTTTYRDGRYRIE